MIYILKTTRLNFNYETSTFPNKLSVKYFILKKGGFYSKNKNLYSKNTFQVYSKINGMFSIKL